MAIMYWIGKHEGKTQALVLTKEQSMQNEIDLLKLQINDLQKSKEISHA